MKDRNIFFFCGCANEVVFPSLPYQITTNLGGWNNTDLTISEWFTSEVQGARLVSLLEVSQIQSQGVCQRLFSGSSGEDLLPGSFRSVATFRSLQL